MVNLMFVQSSMVTPHIMGGDMCESPVINLSNVKAIQKGSGVDVDDSDVFYISFDSSQWFYKDRASRDVDYNRVMRKLGLHAGSVAGD